MKQLLKQYYMFLKVCICPDVIVNAIEDITSIYTAENTHWNDWKQHFLGQMSNFGHV